MHLISTAIMVDNKGNFEKIPGHNFFKFSLNIYTSIWLVYLKFYANHLFVVYAMRIINYQCRITCNWLQGTIFLNININVSIAYNKIIRSSNTFVTKTTKRLVPLTVCPCLSNSSYDC